MNQNLIKAGLATVLGLMFISSIGYSQTSSQALFAGLDPQIKIISGDTAKIHFKVKPVFSRAKERSAKYCEKLMSELEERLNQHGFKILKLNPCVVEEFNQELVVDGGYVLNSWTRNDFKTEPMLAVYASVIFIR